jgi:hypothetical protein
MHGNAASRNIFFVESKEQNDYDDDQLSFSFYDYIYTILLLLLCFRHCLVDTQLLP